jgi:hypothetical protein
MKPSDRLFFPAPPFPQHWLWLEQSRVQMVQIYINPARPRAKRVLLSTSFELPHPTTFSFFVRSHFLCLE